jgi:hypothetical protein
MTLKETIKKVRNFQVFGSHNSEEDFVDLLREILNNKKEQKELKQNSVYRNNVYNLISYIYIADRTKMSKNDNDKLWSLIKELDETEE